ncbi:muconolactone Delta-isomerase family protein [Streptomyces heilongjiangensis]|uniref:Muconolactone Delta-isomerase n=1 Tax=Streptomyces heilongjiangensis TaxID=945052 RepID=A0ABW1BJ96_9ACTN|nr:muconolactone Delta-isomerase family protein [Streptomyces heilongjiangensis]MDC2952449.1 muconolactone Delta-isomerase family protein [Streptomyces heilongjiangensis]
MLFAVRMTVALPPDTDPDAKASVVTAEREYAQQLQHAGEWLHLWRCVGRYSNLSIFDVTGNDRLNEILWSLPLFPYMDITVTPLSWHPSAVR